MLTDMLQPHCQAFNMLLLLPEAGWALGHGEIKSEPEQTAQAPLLAHAASHLWYAPLSTEELSALS